MRLKSVPYLFPKFIVLLQESQRSGLKASEQDFQFLLQFSCSSSLCCHVTTVHLKSAQTHWTRILLQLFENKTEQFKLKLKFCAVCHL